MLLVVQGTSELLIQTPLLANDRTTRTYKFVWLLLGNLGNTSDGLACTTYQRIRKKKKEEKLPKFTLSGPTDSVDNERKEKKITYAHDFSNNFLRIYNLNKSEAVTNNYCSTANSIVHNIPFWTKKSENKVAMFKLIDYIYIQYALLL